MKKSKRHKWNWYTTRRNPKAKCRECGATIISKRRPFLVGDGYTYDYFFVSADGSLTVEMHSGKTPPCIGGNRKAKAKND